MFDEELYLICAICKDKQIPKQPKVPTKCVPAKPAAKRAAKQAAQFSSALSSNPRSVPELPTEYVEEFKVVWSSKKKFHTLHVERAPSRK